MENSPAVEETARALIGRADALAAEIVGRITRDVPTCARSPEALQAAVRTELRAGLAAALGADVPEADHLPPYAWRDGGHALPTGIPLPDLLRAYHVGADIVWTAFVAECANRGVSTPDAMSGAALLWHWVHESNTWIAAALAADADAARAAATRAPDDVLRGALLGEAGCRPRTVGPVIPFRARSLYEGGPVGLGRLDRHVARDEAGELMVTSVGTDAAGLLRDVPDVVPARWVMGIGAPTQADSLAAEFERAGQSLHVAHHFGLNGVWSMESLGLRGCVLTEPETGERLWRLRLAPLEEIPRGAELVEAVGAYLANGMRIESAARALYLHPNTLRNRLRKFEDVTGSNLRDPVDVAEVWWSFAYRALHGSPD